MICRRCSIIRLVYYRLTQHYKAYLINVSLKIRFSTARCIWQLERFVLAGAALKTNGISCLPKNPFVNHVAKYIYEISRLERLDVG